jgi:hypothetical protein
MSVFTSAQKRARAAAITPTEALPPVLGNLDVEWASPFDRLCYDVSAAGLARKQPARYGVLMQELTERSGCSEDELLDHGFKVRSVLFFAEDRLGRQGLLSRLVGNQQIPFRLAPVTQSF